MLDLILVHVDHFAIMVRVRSRDASEASFRSGWLWRRACTTRYIYESLETEQMRLGLPLV